MSQPGCSGGWLPVGRNQSTGEGGRAGGAGGSDGGGGADGTGGEGGTDGGGNDGGGRGGKMMVAAATLSVLAATPRLLASEEVTVLELRVDADAAAAASAVPSIVMVMVTETLVVSGVATETLWPREVCSELVSAPVSSAASVAFELRLCIRAEPIESIERIELIEPM